MKVAILTSLDQWFVPYAKKLQTKIDNAYLFFRHEDIDDGFEIIFILSYHKIIQEKYLKKHKHNIVIHESALPNGKGWAPMFWQVIEGKDKIPFSMFEAGSGVDNGDIYMQETLTLSGYELNKELREKQANFTSKMCLEFLNKYDRYKVPKKQIGEESFYAKRTSKDSQLDVTMSIEEQFNLLRIVNNEEYPAFFEIDDHKYKLTIEKMEK